MAVVAHNAKNSKQNEKSARSRRKHCAADPLPGGAGPPKFNQLEMVIIFTYRPSFVKIDACNFELS